MNKFDIRKATKTELIWMATHCCKHGHKYLAHPKCFDKERHLEKKERIGFLDIETSDLNAAHGVCLSYAIKELGGKVVGRTLTPDEVKTGVYDRDLMRECVKDMVSFDRLIGYYCIDRRFDFPFIRSRCLKNHVWFPNYKDIVVSDCYSMAKNKLKLRSNRLQAVCEFLGISSKGHKLDPHNWLRCLAGDQAALDYVWVHNVEDVESTEEVWRRLVEFQAPSKTSI